MKTLFKSILLGCLVFFGTTAFAQLHADFTSTTAYGCSPLIINFIDQSTGGATSWYWDFGNGNTSIQHNPAAAYLSPGLYTVKLVIKNGSQTDSVVKTNYVDVYFPPNAALSASDTVGCTPKTISFTDQSTPGSAAINNWTWDFGDGTTSSLQNPQHTYINAGARNIVLLVRDANGCTNRITLNNYINVGATPTAAFVASTVSACGLPKTITFTNNSTGANSYLWDFGDGTTDTTASPRHVYTVAGTFSVKLIATAGGACSNTLTKSNYITLTNFQSAFNIDHSIGCTGSTFHLTDQSSPSPNGWSWNFGNGRTSSAQNPSVSYATAGTYTITLTSRNAAGCTSTSTKTVTVTTPPLASFTADTTQSCTLPFTVNFSGTPNNMAKYIWDFGDGTIDSSSQTPQHTYTTAGSYAVKLTVVDPGGCTNTKTLSNFIVIKAPTVAFTVNRIKGCAPLSVTFTDQSVSATSIVSWFWDFGDGNTSTLQNPTNIFDTSGLYTIQLVITTASGCVDTLTKTDYIKVGERPNTNFVATPTTTCAFTPVAFTDSTPHADQWYWDFGDGGNSVAPNPIHHYSDTGTFTVSLITWYRGCIDTMIKTNYIHILPPIAHFTPQFTCINFNTVTFNNTSIGGNLFVWSFGNGDSSNVFSPTYTYTNRGSYHINLVVLDTVSGCFDSTSTDVLISHPIADFASASQSGCKPFNTTFTSNSQDAVTYFWDFGDNATSNSPSPAHTYANTGQYTVKLVITDAHGCVDSIIKTNYITVYGAKAGFSGTPTTGCAPLPVTYMDSSSSFMGAITNWYWTMGNGDTSTLQNPTEIYTVPGSYTITLKVMDSNGCADTLKRVNYINPTFPTPKFNATPTTLCKGATVAFNNQSTGNGLTYAWDFGDSTTSIIKNPTHQYADTGYYSVTLKALDVNGCDSQIVKANYIHVIESHASFTVDTTFAFCPPLTVHFTDGSHDSITGWRYYFGDGQASNLQNPTHIYTLPGVYHPWLVASNYIGCTDTMYLADSIVLNGPAGRFDFVQPSVCIPFSVTFVAHTTNNVASYVWDYGDGNVHIDTDTSIHAYTTTGTFNPVLIIRDSVGCTQSIPSPRPILATTAHAAFSSVTNYLCGQGTVAFVDQSSAWQTLSTWKWYFGDGTTSNLQNPTHTYTTAGAYNVKLVVTNSSGCTDSVVHNNVVVQYPKPHAAFVASDTAACFNKTINFTNQSTSDSTIASVLWDFGDGVTASGNSASHVYPLMGSFTVKLIVTTVNGCADTTTKHITIYPLPTPNAGVDRTICVGDTVHLGASGGVGYQWLPATGLSATNIANPIASPTATSNYQVLVTDAHGCQATDSVMVTVNPLPNVTTSADTTVCPGQPANVWATGGVSYVWGPSASLSNGNIANPVANVTANTTYNVTVTDANGCVRTGVTHVNLYSPPVATVSHDTAVCLGFGAQLNASGGVSYLWSPSTGLNNSNIANPVSTATATTVYQVQVTDNQGCKANNSINITIYPLPTPNAGVDRTICVGDTVHLGASGGVGYQWSPATGLSATNIANPVASPTATSNYQVLVTDAHGCQATDSVMVTVNPLPVAIITHDTTICAGSSITLNIAGGATYSWLPASTLSCTNCAGPIATPTAPTTYTVQLTSGVGCVSYDSVTIGLYHVQAALQVSDTAACMPATIQFTDHSTADGGVTNWLWNFGNGDTSTNQNTAYAYRGFGNHTITLTVTSVHGCVDSANTSVRVFLSPAVNAGSAQTICKNDSVQLQATGANSYQWTPSIGLDNPSISAPIASPDSTTLYTVVATDVHGCQSIDSVMVHVNPLPIVTATGVANICTGDSAQLTATGGINYLWSPSTGLTSAIVSNPKASPSSTTNYVVNVTDSNGCRNTANLSLAIFARPNVQLSPDTAICFGQQVALSASGALHYNWSPSATLSCDTCANAIALPSVTTTYKVTYTGVNGCLGYDSVTVQVNALPIATKAIDTAMCAGTSLTLTATGADKYHWLNNNGLNCDTCSQVIANPSSDQVYPIQLSTNLGCTSMDTINVKVHHVKALFTQSDTVACSPAMVQFANQSFADTGFTSHTFNFGDGAQDSLLYATHNYTSAGSYTISLIVNTNAGCSDTATKQLTVLLTPTADAGPDRTICLGDTVQFAATGNGSYQWNNTGSLINATSANAIANPSSTTVYRLIVTNTDGCKAMDSLTVTVNPVPIVSIAAGHPICQGDTLRIAATGGGTYLWSPATGLDNPLSANPLFTADSTRAYQVLVTNSYGCQAMYSTVVKVNPRPSATIKATTDICIGDAITLTGFGDGAIKWSPAGALSCDTCANPMASPTTDMVYVLTITNNDNCAATDTQQVHVHPYPQVHTMANATICKGDSITLATTAINADYYNWTSNNSLNDSTLLSPVAKPTATTKYLVSAVSQYGCSAQDSVTITVIQHLPLAVSSDTSLCAGTATTVYAYTQALGSNPVQVTWLPATQFADPHSLSQVVNPGQSATYSVVATSGACSSDTQSVHVSVNPLPTVYLGNNLIVFLQQEVNIKAITTGNIVGYNWAPTACDNCPSITFTASQPVNYSVTVTDNAGCTASDTLKIRLVASCEEDIYMPNSFSPNGDGMNDVYRIRGTNLKSLKLFRIFDRWGNLVFETNDINRGWDGTYHGQRAAAGVYVYYIEAGCRNGGEVTKKGNVTLLR